MARLTNPPRIRSSCRSGENHDLNAIVKSQPHQHPLAMGPDSGIADSSTTSSGAVRQKANSLGLSTKPTNKSPSGPAGSAVAGRSSGGRAPPAAASICRVVGPSPLRKGVRSNSHACPSSRPGARFALAATFANLWQHCRDSDFRSPPSIVTSDVSGRRSLHLQRFSRSRVAPRWRPLCSRSGL
jgi:hypothetical protein